MEIALMDVVDANDRLSARIINTIKCNSSENFQMDSVDASDGLICKNKTKQNKQQQKTKKRQISELSPWLSKMPMTGAA